jgi:prepilin-type N-terminal cleavage/methylation domain-containing protein
MNSVLQNRATSAFPISRSASRSGFTLIEMMIVIGIMLMLVTAAATMIRPASESRRIREAARSINVYLSSARNRAMETGRPCGVTFRCQAGASYALAADQCEVPPCYAGDSDTSTATLAKNAATGVITATLDTAPPSGMVKKDDLIQFNYQGPMYKVDGTLDSNNYITSGTVSLTPVDSSQNQLTPWPIAPTQSQPMPYRIFRAPVKGGTLPMQLPARSAVDLKWSGQGNAYLNGAVDYTVLFSPTGAVESVNGQPATDTIYLLLGSPARAANGYTPGNTNETTWTNFQDLNNLWVTINPRTGVIGTEPVATCQPTATEADAIIQSRTLAAQGQGMGGK